VALIFQPFGICLGVAIEEH